MSTHLGRGIKESKANSFTHIYMADMYLRRKL